MTIIQATPIKEGPVCTKENPASVPEKTRDWLRVKAWNSSYSHPDAVGRCINNDYDDWQFDCPYCGRGWIYEGPDS